MSIVQRSGAPATLVTGRAVRQRDGAAGPDVLGLLAVSFAPYGQPYEINSAREGRFIERVAPGAFARAIERGGSGIKVLFNHGKDAQIGHKVLGPVASLTDQRGGPVALVELLDTSYNRDLLPGLRAGVYGSSFMFNVRADHWNSQPEPSESNPDGLPERVLRDVNLLELGPVTWPANPAATAALTDQARGWRGNDPSTRVLRLRLAGVA